MGFEQPQSNKGKARDILVGAILVVLYTDLVLWLFEMVNK